MKRVIALGFFDGVHMGHGALLRLARKRADRLGCAAAALTFDPHPNEVIFGEKTPLINTLAERRELMTGLYAVEEMLILPFNRTFMEMDWQDFVREILIERFEAVHVVCGYDYTFGYRGLGNAAKLQQLCRELGLGCDVVKKVQLLGEEVSSTRIRRLLEQGKLEEANTLLGHRHFISGPVIHGKKLGRVLGFPTANVALGEGILEPARGVYATVITCDSGVYKAVTNVGSRPTVGKSTGITAESYLLDFEGDLYGQLMKVEFVRFLRPEQKFEDLQQLKQAVQNDIEQVKKDEFQ